jgi:hypothetical protein
MNFIYFPNHRFRVGYFAFFIDRNGTYITEYTLLFVFINLSH